ncbi:bifunctional phosphopantothenoylcysteine decarboxylase/phosphopantothenate--cysteine ligase CoaBC [Kangiella sp.]|uniref:bifunctional phosphopantothenoylcysteine decarboxylase/phosphopantothenate--cysteine ligase CoaBC n=1 Tax=Kangiella sp. TaxID=1920245 RepID=UPI0019CE89CF|nr:bifunctional phosphopantothenoylcysteine decarboxylase/phosphopantothenate--cysteine ligase CoaBC [Kangiella sp.]MBD3652540.1 bifunctional phosphopantothenoylcysteine decarboxylase/phosphopantothenate--cysteine ligase CoaBC [Kangiella sp.]
MKLQGKKVLLGITGGIAAYKSAELCRNLKKAGAEVRVVMTKGAQAFITPLTLQALSGNPVHHDLLDPAAEAAMGHIELARWADFIVIAPASADFIARLNAGMADDLLTTLCLATDSPIVVAPAMNQQMWVNAATQNNIRQLIQKGIEIWGPDEGDQACGDVGPGRMLEPVDLLNRIDQHFNDKPLQGQRWLITAGPTVEPIDPVRYLANRSSGKMGFAIAEAAAKAGAEVILVTGPVKLNASAAIKRIDVQTAQQMFEAVQGEFKGVDTFVACAAVSDYRPKKAATQKLKKQSDEGLTIELTQNPDILKWAAEQNSAFCVGFAAETNNIAEYAEAKMAKKGINVICANDVSRKDIGFSSDNNEVSVYYKNNGAMQVERLGPALKSVIAQQLVNFLPGLK